MSEPIVLPVGVSIAIVSFLLSLLPAGFFLWMWYLRRRTRSVPASTIAIAFGVGLVLVQPAFLLERKADELWAYLSPATEHFYSGAILPLGGISEFLLVAVATFLIVAPIEEGLRYIAMWLWMRRSKAINQVFDGLLVGVSFGLGFSTLENTLYFHELLNSQQYDTLVFVFFLRFIVSTLAHISFAGIMGVYIARGTFQIFKVEPFFWYAFLLPWFLHGTFDLLLGTGFGLYAICILMTALLVLVSWTFRHEFAVIQRENGKFLKNPHPPESEESRVLEKALHRADSPWNINAPWLNQNRTTRSLLRVIHSEHE